MKHKIKFYSGLFCAAFILSALCVSDVNAEEIKIYVSPDGNDSQSGSEAQPLQSLEGAKNAVRKAKEESHGLPITVYFRGGIYPIEETVSFDSQDSGSEAAPITYRALGDEMPVFSGSKRLSQWELLSDEAILDRLLPSVRGKVYVTNVYAAGITDLGDPVDFEARPELVCNQKQQTLARWPNKGFTYSGKLLGESPLEAETATEVAFHYTDSYQDRWAQESEIILCGYWLYDWDSGYQKVERWDAGTRSVYLQKPFSGYGFKDNFRYFASNILCEIDQPGEWYLDRSTGLLYWYPPENTDMQTADIRLTDFSSSAMVYMLDCSYITFEGLAFQDGRGSSIIILGGTNNLISGCRIERFGAHGIEFGGSAGRNNGITGCYLSDFGYSGILLEGGDRKTLTPANHFVENTIIEHFSLFHRTYDYAICLIGCGMRVAHNRIQFGSTSAIRIEGNDFTIEYNQFSHLVTESDDQGGIDMWNNPSYQGNIFRYNYWADINGAGGEDFTAAAIRFDDLISGSLVTGNLFERCGSGHFGAVQIHAGKDNLVDNNIFYQCNRAVSIQSYGEEEWLERLNSSEMQKQLFNDVNIFSDTYLDKYPHLKYIYQDPSKNTITDNLVMDCEQPFNGEVEIQTMNNNPVFTNVSHDNSFCLQSILEQYNIQPLPIENIGLKNNRWRNEAYDPMTASDFINLPQTCDENSNDLISAKNTDISAYLDKSDQLHINSNEPVKQIEIFDMSGKVVLSISTTENSVISLSNAPSGIYIVRVMLQNGAIRSIKLHKGKNY